MKARWANLEFKNGFELIKFLKLVLGKKASIWLQIVITAQLLLSLMDMLFLGAIYPVITNFSSTSKLSSKLFWSLFGSNSDKLWFEVFILATLLAVKNMFSLLLQFQSNRIFAYREATISTSLFKASLKEDMDSRNNRESVDAINTFASLTSQVFGYLLSSIPNYIGEVFSLIAILGTLVFLQPKFSIIMVLILIVISIFLVNFFGSYQKRISNELYLLGREQGKMKIESTKVAPFLILSHQVNAVSARIWRSQVQIQRKSGLAGLIGGMPRFILEAVVLLGMSIALFFTAGTATELLSVIGILIAGVFRALPAISSCINNFSNIRAGLVSLARFSEQYLSLNSPRFEDFDQPSIYESNRRSTDFFGDLIVEDVAFKFKKVSAEIISELNFSFKDRTSTLIKGRSGVGKTTLLYLISGLLKPTGGRIYMSDGNQTVEMGPEVSGLSFVQQNVSIITGTLAQNICGSSFVEIDDLRMRDAIARSGLQGKVDSSELGYHLLVGEDGKLLSAGERQRVGIARALYANPKLLILDEPTANLDLSTEAEIWKTIEELKGKLTIIVVSHREVPESTYDAKLVMGVPLEEARTD
jgi:ABC-type multidrug transport system fused ATPase/permease subunit